MTDRYQEIRQALAMGPTPGPWTAKSHAAPRADNGDIGITNGKGVLVAVAYSNRCTRDNASLIAACDPDTIRALLAERDALVEALAAQQPAAVDEAMVFRLAVWMANHDGCEDPHRLIYEGSPPVPWGEVWNRYEYDARAALTAALATQQQEDAK